MADLRKETLENLSQAIEKIGPYKTDNLQMYEVLHKIREGIKRNKLHSEENLQRVNQIAKKHISDIEDHKREIEKAENNRNIEQEKTEEIVRKGRFKR